MKTIARHLRQGLKPLAQDVEAAFRRLDAGFLTLACGFTRRRKLPSNLQRAVVRQPGNIERKEYVSHPIKY